ncbi:MAG: methylenetetrahydrofolate reductase [Bacteroidaceae bacterium]|nr:methylenetetrahydrofolate reductase [NAD(P)H] [Bacteroidaceae bacterium]
MKITDLIGGRSETAFSFEVLPPLKGTGFEGLRHTISRLNEFGPSYINITTHRSEYVYKDMGDGLSQRIRLRRRPGTVAVAAAIQNEFHVPVVPHILCSGFTREETEYVLLDLQFLGIENLLVLRGDKARDDAFFKPTPDGYSHTTELQEQINRFNAGEFIDGSPVKVPGQPFSYGVACYPEKHEEALNMETDMQWFKRKVELGAEYGVTQLFYDNKAYFRFVERARAEGISVPVIPGIKPLTKLSQLATVPKTFHCDFPPELAREAVKCKTDDEARALGIEWCVEQCRELMAHGVPSLHFYTVSAVDSITEIAKRIF